LNLHLKCLTQYGEVLDQLLNIWREVLATGGAGEDIGGAQVHQAVLTEGVPALEDARDLVLVVVVVVADRARDIHVFKLIT